MAQQLTKDGEILSLRLKSSPIGDIASTHLRYFSACFTKKLKIAVESSDMAFKSGFAL